ncbi:PTS system mannose/fructose/sorbose family transporter subunit IID [Dolosigranulum pigrum]|uniref:PTS system mannose/fructose/sorbose family transporter subunit IID n=1 Tax=Dolosigranulum pigrum TaxID=29394 RepID=UPI000DC5B4BE|nr:PTS system mannose/fructose/sorbose family transporter subunit IID [Dolosigranulum pigrum]QTJ54008.1 PTS system mannose/fructose/sorbose family transporter subunit IID [Dolosigranulum pigrum]RAN51016.1 PTS sugar transporter [Dolosigranulum pigrum]
MSQKKISEKSINRVFWKHMFYGGSWNYERMQNLGFLYTVSPFLKDLYKNKSSDMSKAMSRHLEFFNTQQSAAPVIMGVTAALEEQPETEEKSETINGLKVGLMGPLAGLGDSLIWLTLVPICLSIGASYASDGNIVGVLLALLLFNVINIPFKYFSLKFGYEKGEDFVATASKEKMDRITEMAIALGLILVGGLIPQMVNLELAVTFSEGDLAISIQELIDDIFPQLLPLLTTLGLYKLLRKGKNPVLIILGIIVLSVVLTSLGWLAA